MHMRASDGDLRPEKRQSAVSGAEERNEVAQDQSAERGLGKVAGQCSLDASSVHSVCQSYLQPLGPASDFIPCAGAKADDKGGATK